METAFPKTFPLLPWWVNLNSTEASVPGQVILMGKTAKKTGPGQYISINSLHATTWADSLSEEKVGFHLTTLEWMVHMKGFSLLAEGGLGNYFQSVQDAGNGGLISATLTTPAKKTLPRWSLHYFYISPKVINNNSIFSILLSESTILQHYLPEQ